MFVRYVDRIPYIRFTLKKKKWFLCEALKFPGKRLYQDASRCSLLAFANRCVWTLTDIAYTDGQVLVHVDQECNLLYEIFNE